MKSLIKYIFTLVALISIVHFTKDAINFSREILMLKDSHLRAKIKEEKMMHPTVKITSVSPDIAVSPTEVAKFALSSATGFSVKYSPKDDISIVITNEHFCRTVGPNTEVVIENHENASVEKVKSLITGRVIDMREDLDLCVIAADGYIRPAELESFNYTPMPFEEIFVVGGPSGTFPIIFDSYVSKMVSRRNIILGSRMSDEGNPIILISEQVFPGHSGSPVFTKEGKVIGAIFGALRSYGGLAVSVKDIYVVMEDLEI